MNATDFVLALIDAFDGHVEGRSLLQKRAYFISLLAGINFHLGFVTHYYGPYSAVVDDSLNRLRTSGFLKETELEPRTTPTGFKIRRHDYKLTPEGMRAAAVLKQTPEYSRIADTCNAIAKAGNPDRLTLSIAARAHYVLKKRRQEMSLAAVVREVQRFNSTIPKASLDNSVQFLEGLNLIQH